MTDETTENAQAAKLILAIELVDSLVGPGGFPANNTTGTILLARLLDSTLESAGQLLSPTSCTGPLNHCICMCYVRGVNESARIICQVLKKAALESGVRVLRFDKGEGVLRCIWPAAGDVVSEDEFAKQFVAASGLTVSAMARSNQWLQHLEQLQQELKPGDDPKP